MVQYLFICAWGINRSVTAQKIYGGTALGLDNPYHHDDIQKIGAEADEIILFEHKHYFKFKRLYPDLLPKVTRVFHIGDHYNPHDEYLIKIIQERMLIKDYGMDRIYDTINSNEEYIKKRNKKLKEKSEKDGLIKDQSETIKSNEEYIRKRNELIKEQSETIESLQKELAELKRIHTYHFSIPTYEEIDEMDLDIDEDDIDDLFSC